MDLSPIPGFGSGISRRAAVLSAVIFLIGFTVLIPGFVRLLNALAIKTLPAAFGVLKDERTLHALVLRDEVVATAPISGVFAPLAREESRVRAGESIGLLVSDQGEIAVKAPRPGVVRFHWDGLEEVLTPESVWQQTPSQWRLRDAPSDRSEALKMSGGQYVQQGSPLVRLVNSHTVRLYADMPPGVGWRGGQTIVLTISDVTGEPIRVKVVETGRVTTSEQAVMIVEPERYLPVLDGVRHVDLQVVLSSHEGIIVPMDALIWDDGGVGVFVRRDGKIVLVPVEILSRVGAQVALQGVPLGAQIIANPWRVTAR